MPRNVEIKARVADLRAIAQKARGLAAGGPREFEQHDVFFHCRRGRLKLRRFADGRGELIAYERADTRGPKTSHYQVVPCADPAAVLAALSASLGILGEVRKQRTLYLVGRTRIHLDRVAGLGDFVELEVVLEEGETAATGESEATRLMRDLGVEPEELVAAAYIDLLTAAAHD